MKDSAAIRRKQLHAYYVSLVDAKRHCNNAWLARRSAGIAGRFDTSERDAIVAELVRVERIACRLRR